MTLWDTIEEIRKEHLDQEVEFQLFYNNFKITDTIPLASFRMNISLDILELTSNKFLIIDKTVERHLIKAPIRYIEVHIKKEVFE